MRRYISIADPPLFNHKAGIFLTRLHLDKNYPGLRNALKASYEEGSKQQGSESQFM